MKSDTLMLPVEKHEQNNKSMIERTGNPKTGIVDKFQWASIKLLELFDNLSMNLVCKFQVVGAICETLDKTTNKSTPFPNISIFRTIYPNRNVNRFDIL